MKKVFTLLSIIILVISFYNFSYGKQINQEMARTVGSNFLKSNTSYSSILNINNLKLIYKSPENSSQSINNNNYFYIFNSNHGFVIVAADDIVYPILGYSDEMCFDANNIPSNVSAWLENYKNQIIYAIENHLTPTTEIIDLWQNYLTNNINIKNQITSNVNPLIQTKWDQSPNYNAYCPYDYQRNDRCVTGCVATAMAQIMKYWKYPAQGNGFHSYNNYNFGTLSANFGSTTYQWDSMPVSINSSNNSIATLMYHCGVSIDMQYGVAATGGSNAYLISSKSPVTNCAEYALKTYFGYSNNIYGQQKSDVGETQWKNLLKADLDAGRPVLYGGFGNGGGHCFVCDGYDNNDYFHFNWGWSGQYDGYFVVYALNPGGVGTGGGTGGYNNGQQAVFGIEPKKDVQVYKIKLYNYINLSKNIINYGEVFSVETNFWNYGTGDFDGDFCAAVFDENLNFVDFVSIITSNLKAGNVFTNNLIFRNSLLSMLPGNYYIGTFYRPTGGNWSIVEDNGNIYNVAQIKVVNSNDIELGSDISILTGTSITQNQTLSLNFNIMNKGATTYYGDYSVDLYKFDGTWVENIGSFTESTGLPSGYTYTNPLSFNSTSIKSNPGSYLLAVQHRPTGNNWQLTGSTYFMNPIKVTIIGVTLNPDIYEENNTKDHAYNFNCNFSGDSTKIETKGSNCHVGNDYDFYKITLNSGFNYNISATMNDAIFTHDEITYTLNSLFSYSTDMGQNWIPSDSNKTSGNIFINNGGTIYFFVSPYFTGETGTYLLSIKISRTLISDVFENEENNLINIFPNPVTDLINFDLNNFDYIINKISISDIHGRQVISFIPESNIEIKSIPTNDLISGIYFIKIYYNNSILTKKITICK